MHFKTLINIKSCVWEINEWYWSVCMFVCMPLWIHSPLCVFANMRCPASSNRPLQSVKRSPIHWLASDTTHACAGTNAPTSECCSARLISSVSLAKEAICWNAPMLSLPICSHIAITAAQSSPTTSHYMHTHTHVEQTVMNKTHCHEHRTFCKRVREITSVWLQPAARHSTCIVQPDPAGLHSRSPAKSVKPSSDNNSISILNYITASCLAFNFPNSPVSACPPQLLCSCKRLWMEICTNTSRLWSSPALQPTFARYLNCSCSALLS